MCSQDSSGRVAPGRHQVGHGCSRMSCPEPPQAVTMCMDVPKGMLRFKALITDANEWTVHGDMVLGYLGEARGITRVLRGDRRDQTRGMMESIPSQSMGRRLQTGNGKKQGAPPRSHPSPADTRTMRDAPESGVIPTAALAHKYGVQDRDRQGPREDGHSAGLPGVPACPHPRRGQGSPPSTLRPRPPTGVTLYPCQHHPRPCVDTR